ncbi:DUF418 domain-containing protein [Tumebacillus lipolyticus]|uniref:DUF418 domain-containing protein n=1 Tax=Tumebacillus lipolyticus TaxID=1280370 RepID=A0ABW4ZUB8_9BACL
MSQPNNANPIQPNERMLELDVLRGFAIFGILIVNMQFFSTAFQYLSRVRANMWTEEGDKLAKLLIDSFASGNFYTMFSFLFGIGMIIFLDRARAKGIRAVPLFLRRVTILLLIGLVHALLIWYGDILVEYAVLSFFLILFARAKPRLVLASAFFFLLLRPVLTYFGAYQKITVPLYSASGLGNQLCDVNGLLDRANAAYQYGTYGDQVGQRLVDFVYQYGTFWALFPVVFAMFLFGVYAAKKRIFHDVEGNIKLIRLVWLGSLIVALLTTFFKSDLTAVNTISFKYVYSQWFLSLRNPAICFFYVTSIIQLLRLPALRAASLPIATVGRMALSNYLASSLICTTLFYSFGFGLFNKVGPGTGLLISLLIYPLLVVFSILWLRHFRYGPVEWIWRTLTYGKLQSMRLPASKATSTAAE